MEQLGIVTVAAPVIMGQLHLPISSVRVQNEIQVDSFLLQHDACRFLLEAFH